MTRPNYICVLFLPISELIFWYYLKLCFCWQVDPLISLMFDYQSFIFSNHIKKFSSTGGKWQCCTRFVKKKDTKV